MHSRQFTQYILGFLILVSSSFALSNTQFTYNVIDGGIEVTGCVDGCPSDLVIPAEIDGYEVISIIDEAFYVPEGGDEGYDEAMGVVSHVAGWSEVMVSADHPFVVLLRKLAAGLAVAEVEFSYESAGRILPSQPFIPIVHV